MNSTIDTTLGSSVWWRNVMQAVSLVCGLALAAVLAFGMPDLAGGPAPSQASVHTASPAAPEYAGRGPAVLYIVDSEADRLALESTLNERDLLMAAGQMASTSYAEVSIFVPPAGQSPYHILAGEVDPQVQIIDLTEAGRRTAQ
jgi:hypothetical protein